MVLLNFLLTKAQKSLFDSRHGVAALRKYSKNTFKTKMSIKDVNLKGKRVLIRVDYNVPMKDGKVTSDQRIVASIPTIKHAIDAGAKSVILISHMGRPNGQKDPKFTLKPVAPILNKLLGRKVCFVDETCNKEVIKIMECAEKGSIYLLENLRFHAEEQGKGKDEKNKKFVPKPEKVEEFRNCLMQLGEIYVNDAFGTAHRAHSSMLGCGYEVRAAGLLMEKELEFFGKLLHKPAIPFLAILGGAKVSDKLPLIMSMLDKVNEMIIGGGMAFTFLKVLQKAQIGKSLYDKKGAELVPEIMEAAKCKNVCIHLPVDVVAAKEMKEDAKDVQVIDMKEGIPSSHMGLDIGPKTIEQFNLVICRSSTILFNGPPGVFELKPFEKGTKEIMEAIVSATKRGATSVIGGGDTASACKKFKATNGVSHVSTGGGASLELLEGKELPGVAALSEKW